jgi:hypothetical protein
MAPGVLHERPFQHPRVRSISRLAIGTARVLALTVGRETFNTRLILTFSPPRSYRLTMCRRAWERSAWLSS